MSLEIAVLIAAINGDSLVPRVTESVNYKHWISVEDLRRCLICADCHGKIWPIIETSKIEPPVHHNCRCVIEVMKAIAAGTATINGTSGADWCLKYEGKLPDNYISYNDAKKQGFRTYLGNLDKIANGKCLQKDFTVIAMVICQMRLGELGMKRILITKEVTETHKELFFQMTVLYL